MLSVIVPVHNESRLLAASATSLTKALAGLGMDYELLIAEDGSSDATADIAQKLASANPRIRPIITKKRLGRGLSLSNAIIASRGDIVLYMDADLATDLSHIPALIGELERGSDIATGSRLLPGSRVSGRNALRDIASKSYNLLLRLLFRTEVRDHQCGFKAFRRSSILPLLKDVHDSHWFWDSELLIRAQARGMRVAEIPVRWTDRKESGVRLHADIIYMGLAALKLRLAIGRKL
ncbi:glycosyltransferase family 2 protein [Candidatus Micrarchaeota archaeon]|nr:glycosyltransferase family 2 protein [Candidatus Micrarchaeota archaeon]